ncbi:MAG: hypothetical protein IAE85_20040 [Anaerolinea sp.]|nr:hypothetical protein [Anaerolinea sp.]
MAREEMRPLDLNGFRGAAEESKDAADSVSAASVVCKISEVVGLDGGDFRNPQAPLCPVCSRAGTLMAIGDAWMCAACGYASDSAAGCT